MRIILFLIGIGPMFFWGHAQEMAKADAELLKVAVTTTSDNELEISIRQPLRFDDYSLIIEQQISEDIWVPYQIVQDVDYKLSAAVECGHQYRAMLVDQKEGYKPIFLRNKQYSNEYDIPCLSAQPMQLNIYPNPTANAFSLKGVEAENFTMRIFSISGGLIKSYTNCNQYQFDISQLRSASYIVELITDDNQIYTAQLQKI